MPRRFASLCGALALAACTRHTPDTTARVDALMRAYSGAVPGAAVLVLRDGAPLVRRAYGLADLQQRVAATPATNYRLASMTKQFTAAAVLALVDDGRLSLDDAVRRWLPSLPAAADAVTLRQLLTHTSGLIDYEDLIPAGTTQQVHDADVLRLAAHRPERDERGARRWRGVFLHRRSGEVGCGALRHACALIKQPAPRLHTGDADRRSRGALRLRLAHHRGDRVALG